MELPVRVPLSLRAGTGWVVLGASLAAACVAPSVGVDAGPPPDPAAFCLERDLARADFLVRCGVVTPSVGERWRALARPCGLLGGHVELDPGAARACLSQLREGSCATFPADCQRVFVGNARAGEACFDLECAPGAYCEVASACPGRCVPRVPVGSTDEGTCVDGAARWGGECVARLGAGASCAAPDGGEPMPCMLGAQCSRDGVCVTREFADAGGYCDQGLGRWCALGSHCRDDECFPFVKEGQPCRADDHCQGGLRCDGTCASWGELGMPCTRASGCQAPLWCDTAECQAPLPEGAACQMGLGMCGVGLTCAEEVGGEYCRPRAPRGTRCYPYYEPGFCGPGLHCNASALVFDGTCEPQRPGGTKCSANGECQSQRCNDDGGCAPACLKVP